MPKLYVGTYTHDLDTGNPTKSQGIYVFHWENSVIKPFATYSDIINPTFFAISKNNIYTCNEYIGKGQISSYHLDSNTGALKFLNTIILPRSSSTCYISLSLDHKWLFGANYFSGNIFSCSILPNGALGDIASVIQHVGSSVITARQSEAHAHSTTPDPSGDYLIAADLGMDQLLSYKINRDNGKLTTNPYCAYTAVPSGEGPRHLVFHPTGNYAYLSTEIGGHVIVYDYDRERGYLQQKQILSTLPNFYQGQIHVSHIGITEDAKFLLVGNRGHDSIAIFAIDEKSGKLELTDIATSYGHFPRHFCFDSKSNTVFIANRLSNNIAICELDTKNGKLCGLINNYPIPSPTFVAIK